MQQFWLWDVTNLRGLFLPGSPTNFEYDDPNGLRVAQKQPEISKTEGTSKNIGPEPIKAATVVFLVVDDNKVLKTHKVKTWTSGIWSIIYIKNKQDLNRSMKL